MEILKNVINFNAFLQFFVAQTLLAWEKEEEEEEKISWCFTALSEESLKTSNFIMLNGALFLHKEIL